MQPTPGGSRRPGLQGDADDGSLNFDAIEPVHKPGTRFALRNLRAEREMPPVVAVIEGICNEHVKQQSPRRGMV